MKPGDLVRHKKMLGCRIGVLLDITGIECLTYRVQG